MLDGWPVDTLDQTALVEFRKLADQTGWTIARLMREITEKFVERLKAEKELERKIIRFPIPNEHLRSSSAKTSAAGLGRDQRFGPHKQHQV
jgi:hypothetical protein